mmetsp:Transcript_16970/g.53486  ORF Transcript_16970/g.53486 Transcript_16970/m.53486 type:complete len:923 (-) Transcript_16970:287-3055(-)
MGLRRHVREVDAQTKHVAAIPLVALGAMLAAVVADGGAEPLAAGDRAVLRGLAVGGWLQAVGVDGVQDPVVRAVVELPHGRLRAVLLAEVPPVVLVEPRERGVPHGVDRHDVRLAVVEGPRVRELAREFLALGAAEVHGQQREAGVACRAGRVAAPAGPRVPQVLPAAVARDPAGAALGRRAVEVVHADAALLACLEEGQLVEAVHERPGRRCLQLYVGLLELAADDLQPQALGARTEVLLEEAAHVVRELLVRQVRVQEADPQRRGPGLAHEALLVRRDGDRLGLRLGAPARQRQDPLELRAARAAGGIRREAQDEERQRLGGRGDDVVALRGHPDVVAVAVRRVAGLPAQAEPADQHVAAEPGVEPRDLRVLGEVLAGAVDLAAPAPGVEAALADGEHVLRVRAVEALQLIRRAAKGRLHLLAPLVEAETQKGVVHGPRGKDIALATALLPELAHGRQLARRAGREAHSRGRRRARAPCPRALGRQALRAEGPSLHAGVAGLEHRLRTLGRVHHAGAVPVHALAHGAPGRRNRGRAAAAALLAGRRDGHAPAAAAAELLFEGLAEALEAAALRPLWADEAEELRQVFLRHQVLADGHGQRGQRVGPQRLLALNARLHALPSQTGGDGGLQALWHPPPTAAAEPCHDQPLKEHGRCLLWHARLGEAALAAPLRAPFSITVPAACLFPILLLLLLLLLLALLRVAPDDLLRPLLVDRVRKVLLDEGGDEVLVQVPLVVLRDATGNAVLLVGSQPLLVVLQALGEQLPQELVVLEVDGAAHDLLGHVHGLRCRLDALRHQGLRIRLLLWRAADPEGSLLHGGRGGGRDAGRDLLRLHRYPGHRGGVCGAAGCGGRQAGCGQRRRSEALLLEQRLEGHVPDYLTDAVHEEPAVLRVQRDLLRAEAVHAVAALHDARTDLGGHAF